MDATDAIVRDARDFLLALDRGDFGAGTLQHDGVESAYVQAMRDSLARYSAKKQAEYFEEDYARPVADLWGEVHRSRYGRGR